MTSAYAFVDGIKIDKSALDSNAYIKVEIDPTKSLTDAIFYLTQTKSFVNTVYVEYVPSAYGSAINCATLTTNGVDVYDGRCSGEASAWQVVVTDELWLYLNQFAIFPASSCTHAIESYFDEPTKTIQYDPTVGDPLHYDLIQTANFVPTWCTSFVTTPVAKVFLDSAYLVEDPETIVTFDGTEITVQTLDTGLVGTTKTVYLTHFINGDVNDLITEPITLNVEFVGTCATTSFVPFTLPDVSTVYNVPLIVFLTTPDYTAAIAVDKPKLCGPTLLGIIDNTSGTVSPDYSTLVSTSHITDELTLVATSDLQVGTHMIDVHYISATFVSIDLTVSFTVTFTCPPDVEVFTIDSTPSTTIFIHDLNSASPTQVQLSTFTHESAHCFPYTTFEVQHDSGTDCSNLFEYSETTGVIFLFGDPSVSGTTGLYSLVLNFDTATPIVIDNFEVTWYDCWSAVIAPTGTNVYFTQTLDETRTIQFPADNTMGILTGDPMVCGPRISSYVEDLTLATVPYATVIDTTTDLL